MITAFMLACYMNGALNGAIYFKSVKDCTFYSENLSEQTYDTANGKEVIYKCLCKVVPNVDTSKVKVY